MTGRKGSRAQIVKSRISGYYDSLREDQGKGCYEAAKALGFPCYATFTNRMRRPGKFTLDELEGVANAVGISVERLIGD